MNFLFSDGSHPSRTVTLNVGNATEVIPLTGGSGNVYATSDTVETDANGQIPVQLTATGGNPLFNAVVVSTVSTPEPATLGLLGTAACALLCRRSRRR